jgi:dienelactone hydrolase
VVVNSMDLAGGKPEGESGRRQCDDGGVMADAVPVPAPRVRASGAIAAALLVLLAGCSALPPPQPGASSPGRRFTTTVLLNGEALELHLAAPRTPAAPGVLVLYATGDGGWYPTAKDMFRQVADAGYFTAGFSSRSFLKLQRPRSAPLDAAQLAAEYRQIMAQARTALGLDATTRAILTGWSRGAAFAVLVASEPAARSDVLGVVAIGLADGEDLNVDGPADETDDGRAPAEKRRWPFQTYGRIARLGPLPCAVIQATGDGYLPAARARELFGPDTPRRRFYAIDARNHRFSGGGAAFSAAWLDALRWAASQAGGTEALELQ